MATKAEIVRTYCEITKRPVADAEHRAERLRKAGMLPTTGRGPYAARLDYHHTALCLIAFMAIHEPAIAAPEVVEAYGTLLLDHHTLILDAEVGAIHPPTKAGGVATFLDALTAFLRDSRERRYIGQVTIQRITLARTDKTIRAAITVRDLSRQDCVEVLSFSNQAEPELPLSVDSESSLLIEQQCAIDGRIIDVLADLFSKAENENGPSVRADEPLPSDATPRACKPATTSSHLEARRERDKSQVGFESYGDASDGSSLSIRGTTDEDRSKRYG
jgi:hypothetical protein